MAKAPKTAKACNKQIAALKKKIKGLEKRKKMLAAKPKKKKAAKKKKRR